MTTSDAQPGAFAATAPFVWDRTFEAAYDAPAGRWLAFGALNGLEPAQMRRLWLGQLMEAQPFFFPHIALRRSLWPPWLSDYFEGRWIRYCPACVRNGYLSHFQQIPVLDHCPWHGRALTDACRRCGVWRAYSACADGLHPHCRVCRTRMFPTTAARFVRNATFREREREVFGPMAAALALCGRIQVTQHDACAEDRPQTSQASGEEILMALAGAGVLPVSAALALVPQSVPLIEVASTPVVATAPDPKMWKARLARFRRDDAGYAQASDRWATDRLNFALPAASFEFQVSDRCRRLLGRCFHRMLGEMYPPNTSASWDLVLRAFWHDCTHNPPAGPEADFSSLRHWLCVHAPGREPTWVVLRCLSARA